MAEELEEKLEVEVKPAGIEQALKKLRAEKSGEPAGSEPVGKPNILLSNFVITTSSPLSKVREQIEVLLLELAVMLPSRFFIVSLAEEDIKELKTAVNVREIKSSTGHQFFSEEIFITASHNTLPLISSLLRSLFISDVSIISYVVEEPSGHQESTYAELLQYLRGICDLFLYDSKEFADYSNAISSLISLRRIVRPHGESESRKLAPTSVRLRDLNWYRHEKLRSLLAGVYDTSSFSSGSIKEVEVVVNRNKPSPTGLLLAGWLGEALENKEIIKLTPAKLTSGESESFVRIIVRGDGFEISVSQDGDKFEVSSGGTVRKLNSKPLTTAQLISLPIQSSGLDDYFTKSLEQSLLLAEKWA